jgi:hypothetical protein
MNRGRPVAEFLQSTSRDSGLVKKFIATDAKVAKGIETDCLSSFALFTSFAVNRFG